MKRAVRRWAPLAIGIVVAAVCARLGLWQLDRLEQRRVRNATIREALSAEPVQLDASPASPASSASLHYHRAQAAGTLDFSHQQVVVLRPLGGVPGVHIATPLRLSDTTAVLVVRGWVASPDGKTVDLAALSEPESTTVRGYVVEAEAAAKAEPSDWPAFVRRADPALVPNAVVPRLVLWRTELPATAPAVMWPLELPELTNGPHLSYAIQWFAFGVIAIVGSAALVAKGGRREP